MNCKFELKYILLLLSVVVYFSSFFLRISTLACASFALFVVVAAVAAVAAFVALSSVCW